MFQFTPITRDDLPFVVEIRNECREFLHDNRRFTLWECQQWFESAKPNFVIIWLNGERIGYFRLSKYDQKDCSILIGADLHESFRGRGLARKAYESFLPQLDERYPRLKLKLEVLSHNNVAYSLYRKLGFVETDRRADFAMRNGVLVDSIVMEKPITAPHPIRCSLDGHES
jgi:RimJ/RimL family protein N-acetyltransferase